MKSELIPILFDAAAFNIVLFHSCINLNFTCQHGQSGHTGLVISDVIVKVES